MYKCCIYALFYLILSRLVDGSAGLSGECFGIEDIVPQEYFFLHLWAYTILYSLSDYFGL